MAKGSQSFVTGAPVRGSRSGQMRGKVQPHEQEEPADPAVGRYDRAAVLKAYRRVLERKHAPVGSASSPDQDEVSTARKHRTRTPA